jgi:circadian clock protein KaiC
MTTGQAATAFDAPSGIKGLDHILCGGFTPNRMYLLEGVPGSGKTTLAMQFLFAGVAAGESVLYVSLSESLEELRSVADSHGWSLDGLHIRELIPQEESLQPEEQYTIFHPSEIELTQTTAKILADVDTLKPRRVVFDSLSELRLLIGNSLRYRRQILALKQYFTGRQCTVLLLDDLTATDRDLQVQSIAHGVIALHQMIPEYGADRRRLRVVKMRGKQYRGGYHDYVIRKGGLDVFPRLTAAEHRRMSARVKMSSGIVGIDALLNGGIDRGTSTLLVGAPGTGKSSIAAQFARTAAHAGSRAALFIFDESTETLLARMEGLGLNLRPSVEAGTITIQQIDPAEMSPGEFAQQLRHSVDEDGASLIVIDSLNGYLNAMPEEHYLTIQLHELLTYLGQKGVATILIGAHQGLIGAQMQAPVDASYLADTVILMRYFETRGEVRQAISVVKQRGGPHERTIREFTLDHDGIHVGEPLRKFRGVLTGVPVPEDEGASG